MFQWLWRLFRPSTSLSPTQLRELADLLNANSSGGPPTQVFRELGSLEVPSGTVLFSDPQYEPAVAVSDLAGDRLHLSANLWEYPSGYAKVAELVLATHSDSIVDRQERVGSIAIDSAKLVVVDKLAYTTHWVDVGPDRIGEVSTLNDDRLRRYLETHFPIRFERDDGFNAISTEPVSKDLEEAINVYLKSIPKYANFPFMHFRIRTNDSFERVNGMQKPWDFLAVGNMDQPLMFACSTGHGDGRYDVVCSFARSKIVKIVVRFMEVESDSTPSPRLSF